MRSPIIAVLGHKNSGKTLVIETLLGELTKVKSQVAVIKHISNQISYDHRKDTWRYLKLGANPIIAISDEETLIRLETDNCRINLKDLLELASKSEALFLEGFSSLVLSNNRVGKILCIRDFQEYEYYKREATGKIIAFCSLKPIKDYHKHTHMIG